MTCDAADFQALRHLLEAQPVATLATLHRGRPATSMVPLAQVPGTTSFVIHVSQLATHTADMLAEPEVSLLVMAPRVAGDSPLSLARASIQGRATRCDPEDDRHAVARSTYLARFPEAAELFDFADFQLFLIEARAVRVVLGFGRALSWVGETLQAALAAPAQDDTVPG
jgi:putative heme iron utilization protein